MQCVTRHRLHLYTTNLDQNGVNVIELITNVCLRLSMFFSDPVIFFASLSNLNRAREIIKGTRIVLTRHTVQLSRISLGGWSKMDFLTNWWFGALVIVTVLLVRDAIDKSGRIYRAINKFAGPPCLPLIGTLCEILFMNQGKVL